MRNLMIFKIMAVIILAVQFQLYTKAQDKSDLSYKAEAYKAYLANDVNLWKGIYDDVLKNYKQNSNNVQLLKRLVETCSGMAVACIGSNNKTVFNKYASSFDDYSNNLINAAKNDAQPLALRSSIISIKMGLDPTLAGTLGKENATILEKALKINPNEPLALAQMGDTKFHSPAAFGGNTEEAIIFYNKAINSFEAKGDTIKNWHYLNTLAWLGIAYQTNKNSKLATQTFEKALHVEPGFNWVRFVLMPSIK